MGSVIQPNIVLMKTEVRILCSTYTSLISHIFIFLLECISSLVSARVLIYSH